MKDLRFRKFHDVNTMYERGDTFGTQLPDTFRFQKIILALPFTFSRVCYEESHLMDM